MVTRSRAAATDGYAAWLRVRLYQPLHRRACNAALLVHTPRAALRLRRGARKDQRKAVRPTLGFSLENVCMVRGTSLWRVLAYGNASIWNIAAGSCIPNGMQGCRAIAKHAELQWLARGLHMSAASRMKTPRAVASNSRGVGKATSIHMTLCT